MIKILARFWARRSYIWKIEKKAGEEELNAKLSALHADQKRQEAEALNAEADAIEKSVAEYAEKEQKGFWRCEEGRERIISCNCGQVSGEAVVHSTGCPLKDDATKNGQPIGYPKSDVHCGHCEEPMKYIRRDLMTGQEKFESEKERKDAEQMVKNHREKAAALAKEVSQLEGTAQHFRREADRSHLVAQEIKSV